METISGLVFGALLTDLSKTFGCISHELLAAKPIAYGVKISSVRLIYDYLPKRRLRTKVDNKNSSWKDILSGPLLFNIYICDLFLLVNDIGIANYVDDTIPYVSGDKISTFVASLERSGNVMFK